MKGKFIPAAIVLTVLLALSAGLSTAQGPAPQGGGQPQAMLGSAFTYQGELKKDGVPVDDTCSMAFSLYDDAGAGNMVAGPITQSVTVADGLFTVALDFGPGPFTGDARWLEVAVQCTGDAGFNALSPRQALTATPYALSLQPGADILGAVSDDAALYVYNYNTEPSMYSYGLMSRVASTEGYGVYGHANAFSGATYGVFGRADSPEGTGVFGHATAATGTTYGVYGQADSSGNAAGVYGYAPALAGSETYGVYGLSNSPTGYGVLGRNAASSGAAVGVYGLSNSPTGYGVLGRNAASSGAAVGVYGRTDSDAGLAIYGYAGSTSGMTCGVYGKSDSPEGRGVYGIAGATDGTARGVYGLSHSTLGTGVYGYAVASSGYTHGVSGSSNSPNGHGVSGLAAAASGAAWGVYGESYSTEGTGVRGHATAGTGATYGVYGRVDSSAGVGVYGYNSSNSSGVAIYGQGPNAVLGDSSTPNYGAVVGRNLATTGDGMGVYGSSASTIGVGVYGYTSNSSGVPAGVVGETESTDGFGVYSWGDLGASGTKSAVVETPDYGWRRLYALESPEVLFEDVGTAQLVEGRAVVAIDPLFAQTVNLERPYQVFLTAQGEAPVLLWVAEKTAASFTVRGVTLDGQAASSSFDYRIIAKRLGYEDARLEPAQPPARARTAPGGLAVPQEQP